MFPILFSCLFLNAQKYGDIVKIKHVLTNTHLHSHAINYGHPQSSGQQQITAFGSSDDNDLWVIKPEHGNDSRRGIVHHGDVIRLEHYLTHRNLHSHAGIPSPVTSQQEVTGFGNNGMGDTNDNWRIETQNGGNWALNQRIRLIHVNTNYALHSHAGFYHPDWTANQQEVTCFGGRDDNDLWMLTEVRTTCPIAFSQENYQGQRFEMCGRGPYNIPFEVKSIQIPVGWEVSYTPHGSECFSDQANSIVSVSTPSLASNPPCIQFPFYVVSKPDGLNKLKVTVITGQDDLRGGNRFFFTLHTRNGFSFPEIPVIPPNGLATNSTYIFEIPVFNSPAENNLNYKDIAAFTIRHDGRPRAGHPFDTYDNWDCRSVLLDWDSRVPKATRFSATRFTGELTSRRYETY